MPSGGVSGWLRKKFTSKNKSPLDRPNAVETTGEQALEISEYTMTDFEFEAIGDLRYCKMYLKNGCLTAMFDCSFCPACIELNEYKRDGRRRIYYVLPLPAWMQQKLEGHPDAELLKYRVRTYSEITKRLALLQLVKSYKNGRISTNEKRRCQIVETMANLHAESHSRLEKLLYAQTEADHHFLGGNVEVEVEMGKDSSKTWCGAVAVALSRRHWSEQYLILTKERMVLQRSRDSKKAAFSLPLSEIRSVRAVPHNYCPVPWLGFFEVETYSRVFTFMVRSDMQINGWLEAFMTAGSASSVPSRLSGGKDSYIREEVFIAKPPCWKIDKKRVYNFRRIAISGQILLNDDKSAATISPNNLSENILRAAFLLTQSDSETNWLRFWDLISQLQCVCLVGLTDTQRLCFFLNIYHVMVIHGCLMFGAPPGWNHWNAFYHQISYIIGFELVSIAEVEHCILRYAASSGYN